MSAAPLRVPITSLPAFESGLVCSQHGGCRTLFQGELDKVGRGAIGDRESGDRNDCEDDKGDHAPAWALWLSHRVLRV